MLSLVLKRDETMSQYISGVSVFLIPFIPDQSSGQTEYFDKKGKKIKVGTTSELENVKGDIWRSKHSVVKDLKRNHSTVLKVYERDIDAALKPDFFTKRILQKPL